MVQQYANDNRLYHTKMVYTQRQLIHFIVMLGDDIGMTEKRVFKVYIYIFKCYRPSLG